MVLITKKLKKISCLSSVITEKDEFRVLIKYYDIVLIRNRIKSFTSYSVNQILWFPNGDNARMTPKVIHGGGRQSIERALYTSCCTHFNRTGIQYSAWTFKYETVILKIGAVFTDLRTNQIYLKISIKLAKLNYNPPNFCHRNVTIDKKWTYIYIFVMEE